MSEASSNKTNKRMTLIVFKIVARKPINHLGCEREISPDSGIKCRKKEVHSRSGLGSSPIPLIIIL